MPDIAKINAVAIADIEKVDGILAANIEKVDGLDFVTFTGLLDTYTGAAAAYSVRRLASAATVLLRVRRETGGGTGDDDEADVAYDSNNTLSLDSAISNASVGVTATTLGQFINVGEVNSIVYSNPDSLTVTASCFVDTWMDQSGNGNDAEQATQGSQPQIHDGTADTDLITENGKPAVEFDGTNEYLISSTWDGSSIDNLSHSRVYSTPSAATANSAGTIWSFGDSLDGGPYILSNASTGLLSGEYVAWSWADAPTFNRRLGSTTYRRAANTQVLEFENWLASGFSFYQDGAAGTIDLNTSGWSTSSVCSPSITTTNRFGMGVLARPAEDVLQAMKAQELIFWDADRSGNRTGIETDINGFFSIY